MQIDKEILTMTFIFWQNILSIHQAPFLSSLSKLHKVVLVVEKGLDERRIQDGWEIPSFGSTEVIINPSEEVIFSMFKPKDAIHVFSGINSYPLIKKSLQIAIKQKVTIGIMAEPFNWIGIKGKLRMLKYFYFRMRYSRYISFILAIGDRGRWCFEKVGFNRKKIFDWGYFTHNISITNYTKRQDLTLIYIGRLNQNKGIIPLLRLSTKYEDKFSKFIIIGIGQLEKEVQEFINDRGSKYEMVKNIPNNQIASFLINADLCILPSIGKDGWGAVINESLMCGTPVLASDYCGASVLLRGIRGRIFSIKNNNLETTLVNYLKELPITEKERNDIRNWADENISGQAAVNYFQEIISYVFYQQDASPIAPWLK